MDGKWVILFVMLAGVGPIAVYGGNGTSKKAKTEKLEPKKPTSRPHPFRERSLFETCFAIGVGLIKECFSPSDEIKEIHPPTAE